MKKQRLVFFLFIKYYSCSDHIRGCRSPFPFILYCTNRTSMQVYVIAGNHCAVYLCLVSCRRRQPLLTGMETKGAPRRVGRVKRTCVQRRTRFISYKRYIINTTYNMKTKSNAVCMRYNIQTVLHKL